MAVQTFEVGEDEEGMRLDRWFRRRMPTLALSHLNKIVRTGEVRVDGARVKTATRLAKGQRVRVPPLKLAAPVAPARETPSGVRRHRHCCDKARLNVTEPRFRRRTFR